MPVPSTPDAFPFPGEHESEAKQKSANEAEAKLKASSDIPQATERRVTVLEQFIRNRTNSRGARFLAMMDRIRALFYDPNTPEGQRRAQQYSGRTGMVRSFLDLYSAVTGQQTTLENIGNPNRPEQRPPSPPPPTAQ